MESEVLKTMKEEQDDSSPHDLSVMDIKHEPVDEDVKNFDSSEYVMKNETVETEALVEPLCVPVKSEQDSEQMSEETIKEENLDKTQTTGEMVSCGYAVKGEEEDAEALMNPLFVRVEAEAYSEGTSEESAMEENFEAHKNVDIKDATKSMTSCPNAQNSVARSCQRIRAPGLNNQAVYSNSEETNKADELSKESLNNRGKSHDENLKKAATSFPFCMKKRVRGEYRKQEGSPLETCRRKSNSSGNNCFRTLVNVKKSRKEMQNTFSERSSSKRSKKVKKSRRSFCCNICGKCFQGTRDLEDHERTHTGDKPFQCALCNKAFTTRGNVVMHMRVHSEERPYKCSYCEKTFKGISELKTHIRVHTGEKPFECNVCRKSFTQNCDLIRHMRIHTGQKPYKCTDCGKAFPRGSNLTVHMRVHTGECPFACNICGSRFISSSNLNSHRAHRHKAA